MGRCNNKRVQAQAEARKNVPSRARFSKGPPKKNTKGRGRGGGRGGGGGRDNSGRGDGRGGGRGGRGSGRGGRGGRFGQNTAGKQGVIDKIAKNVQRKTETVPTNNNRGNDSAISPNKLPKRDALDGVDITKFDKITLPEESIQYIVDLLTKLKVVNTTASASSTTKKEQDEEKEEKQSDKESLNLNADEFYPTFNHDDGDPYDEEDDTDTQFLDDEIESSPPVPDLNNPYALSGGFHGGVGGYQEDNEIEDEEDYKQPSKITSTADETVNSNNDEIKDPNSMKNSNEGDELTQHEDTKQADMEETSLFKHLTAEFSFKKDDILRACSALESWTAATSVKKKDDTNDELKTDESQSSPSNTEDELSSEKLALAMDWLCLHLTEDELKLGFKPNPNLSKSKENISNQKQQSAKVTPFPIKSAAPHPSISYSKPLTTQEWLKNNDKAKRKFGFLRLGFHQDESDQACDMTGPHKNTIPAEEDKEALRILLSLLHHKVLESKQADNALTNNKWTETDLEFAREERMQELEAMDAIFAEDFEVTDASGDEQHYKLKVKNIMIKSETPLPGSSRLHIFTISTYPTMSAPFLLFTNSTMAPTLLRRINTDLILKANSLIGEPIVFLMMDYISEHIPELYNKFLEEKRLEELEIQRRIEEKSIKTSEIVVDLEDEEEEEEEGENNLGKRQRAKLRAAEKAFKSQEELDAEARKKEENDKRRRALVQEANSNVREKRAEQYMEQRQREIVNEEAEREARRVMNAALISGASNDVARKRSETARRECLISHGIIMEEEVGSDEKKDTKESLVRDQKEVVDNDAKAVEVKKSKDGDITETERKRGPSKPTLAFTDRLKRFYKEAAKLKEAGQDPTQVRLVKPASKNLSDNEVVEEDLNIPAPVFAPCVALNEMVDEVIDQQKKQPWLLAPEARAPTKDDDNVCSYDEDLSPDEIKARENTSQLLKSDLERKYKAAQNWEKRNPPDENRRPSNKKRDGPFGERFSSMLSQRCRLPAYKMKDHIVKTIAGKQVTVISGDTGCGKTTQVAQFVLDDYILKGKGANANIIITQPRRISAIGVAERIAAERCEKVGETSGYSIRLENRRSAKTRLLLCTTGILLRRLQVDPDLASVSHVFVDEVHERDIDTDFLLIILKALLLRRKSIKLVLMSATLNSATFSKYFSDCPTVSIPGRAFPVTEYRLEDVLQCTKYEVPEGTDYVIKASDKNKPKYSKSALKKMYQPKYDSHVITSLSIVDETVINYELIAKLLEYITINNDEGAILCFCPGFQEITKLTDELYKNPFFTDSNKVIVHPLHSSLSTAEQTAVFEIPPPGVRKIVISTNIAETSITIEDVVYVVDTGRVKENRQDEVAQMQTLVETWVSRASAKQRRGRAGRVRPGISYHMYSTHMHDNELQDYQLPEMLRVGLEDLVLQVLLLDLGEPSTFLMRAVNPPSALAIKNSLQLLEGLGAVDCEWGQDRMSSVGKSLESTSCEALEVGSGLTALGFHLATLPVDPRVGKMMIYGALFGCIDPALTIAAAMSARSPFMTPFDKRDEADAARKQFSTDGSDHLTTLNAFNKWRELRQRDGHRTLRSWQRDNFLSGLTLMQMLELRRQFADLLKDIGFLPQSYKHDSIGGFRGGRRNQQSTSNSRTIEAAGETDANANSSNLQLVKAILCAGLYPNIIIAPRTLVDQLGKSSKKVGECTFFSRKGDVHLHPSTISFTESRLQSRYCCYHEIVKTSKIYVRDCTTVSEFALLLFGGHLTVHHKRDVITIDDWLHFQIAAKPATLIKHLRAQMEQLLLTKIISPDTDVTGSAEGVALIQAISTLVKSAVQEIPDRSAAAIVKPWTGGDSSHGHEGRGRGRGGRGRGRGRGRGGARGNYDRRGG